MKWLIESSIRFRGLVIAAGVAVVIVGGLQLVNAPIDSLPEFKPTVVEVQTEALGLSAEEVEQLVTVPLEQDLLNGVAFLEDIESVSMPGLSSVVLTFEPGTDLLDARQVVNERLTQAVGVAGLPAVANPPQMLQPLSSTNRVAIIRLAPQELTPIQTSVLARWVIGPRLLGVEGVANVAIFGQRERQIQVLVDPVRLQSEGVDLGQVISTAGNALEVSPLSFLEASTPGTGGFIDTVNQRFQVFHEQAIKTPDQLAQVPMENEDGDALFVNGEPVPLGSVADVVEDHQPLIGDALCSDGICQLLVIEKFPGADTIAVADGINVVIDDMRPGLDGLEIDTEIFRPAEYVTTAAGNLRAYVIIGLVLALAAIAALLAEWRAIAVAAMVLIVAVGAALTVLAIRGETLNLLLLAGLAIGVIVVIDDVVLDVRELGGRVRVADAAGEVSTIRRIRLILLETRSSMMYAALITAVAVVPILFMEGVLGAFLPTVVLSYVLALGVSMAVALTFTPAVASLVLDGAGSSAATRALSRVYDNRLSSRLAGPTQAAVAVVIVVGVGALAMAFVRPSPEPELEERDILVSLEAAPGTSLTAMSGVTSGFVADVAALDDVRTVGAHVGRAVFSDQIASVNEAEVWINLDRNAPYDRTVERIESIAMARDGLLVDVTTHSERRIREVLGRAEQDIVVRVYGEQPSILDAKADEIETAMSRIDGLTDLRIDRPAEEQALRVTVDLTAAQSVGLKPGDVRRDAAILLNGITVGNLFDEQKVFDVVVWGTPALRENIGDVQNLLIETESFGRVRLDQIADVELIPSPAEIRHESVFTYIDVVANVAGRDVTSVAADVDSAVAAVTFPLEHHAELLGGFEERASQQRLMLAMWVGAAFFILLLLQAALNSWKLAGAVALALAMPVAGGLAAVWATGGSLSLGSTSGLFVVFALGVRQALVSIRHYQRLHRDEGIPMGRDLVVRGTRDRFATLTVTTVALLLFLGVIAIRGPSVGFEIAQPMSVVIIGGVIASAVMTLTVLPAVYLRLGSSEDVSIWGEELFDVSLTDIEAQGALGVE